MLIVRRSVNGLVQLRAKFRAAIQYQTPNIRKKLRVDGKVTHNMSKNNAAEVDLDFGDARQGPGPDRGRICFALGTGPDPSPTHLLKFRSIHPLSLDTF
jgi:hypothetical protein